MKVVTTSADEREKVLPLSSKLKSLPEPWSKVYVKKDLHPVYSKENQRIRKKRYDLQTQFNNNNERREVKIVNGQLQVDGVTVDRNLFFSLSASILKAQIKILFWNINGVGNKLEKIAFKKLLAK